MIKPAYDLTLPSIEDDLTLDCRIYHPANLASQLDRQTSNKQPRGAIVAHPYAPLGGSRDDPVVIAVAETLLSRGFVVGTFNFRGAGGSAGRTSWTGKGEEGDFISMIGLLIFYLERLATLSHHSDDDHDDEDPSTHQTVSLPPSHTFPSTAPNQPPIDLILAGYSYGSLVLSRLPHIVSLLSTFTSAALGSTPSLIILRARTLAEHTIRDVLLTQPSRGRRRTEGKRTTTPPSSPRPRLAASSPIKLGGSESSGREGRGWRSERREENGFIRRSLDSPRRVRGHLRRSSAIGDGGGEKGVGVGGQQQQSGDEEASKECPSDPSSTSTIATRQRDCTMTPGIHVSYLLISPVLLPFSQTLCPPGAIRNLPSFPLKSLVGSLGLGRFKTGAGESRHLSDESEEQPQQEGGGVVAEASSPRGQGEKAQNTEGLDPLLHNRTLAIFGTNDGFSSAKRLTGWAETVIGRSAEVLRRKHSSDSHRRQLSLDATGGGMEQGKGGDEVKSRFSYLAVEGAGHFWREERAMERLRRGIEVWITGLLE